jgi:hypothetical protein
MLFAEYFKKHSVGGRISLRRSQFKLATAGNSTMLIWLGKQHLGQFNAKQVADNDQEPTPVTINIGVIDGSKPTSNNPTS